MENDEEEYSHSAMREISSSMRVSVRLHAVE